MEKTWFLFLAGATAVQLVFWLGIFARVAFLGSKKRLFESKSYETSPSSNQQTAFSIRTSIIVCARNEAKNLRQHLPFWLDQSLENFEVIIVDDASEDATAAVLTEFLATEKAARRLRVLTLHEKKAVGKKAALTAGIAAARGQILLLTDADCRPASAFWAAKMVAPFADEKVEIVLGYAPLLPAEPVFLNKLQRFDAAWTALQMFGFALAGQPYMGVGRNLAYRKSLFKRVGGFGSHLDWPSGDDDLFVNEAATARNVAVVLDEKSFCFSAAKSAWPALRRQKARHFSVGSRYKLLHRAMLGLQVLSAGLHYLLALGGLMAGFSMVVVSICIFLRIMALWFVWAFALRRFREKGLAFAAPVFDAFLIPRYAWFSRSIFFRNNKPFHWT